MLGFNAFNLRISAFECITDGIPQLFVIHIVIEVRILIYGLFRLAFREDAYLVKKLLH